MTSANQSIKQFIESDSSQNNSETSTTKNKSENNSIDIHISEGSDTYLNISDECDTPVLVSTEKDISEELFESNQNKVSFVCLTEERSTQVTDILLPTTEGSSTSRYTDAVENTTSISEFKRENDVLLTIKRQVKEFEIVEEPLPDETNLKNKSRLGIELLLPSEREETVSSLPKKNVDDNSSLPKIKVTDVAEGEYKNGGEDNSAILDIMGDELSSIKKSFSRVITGTGEPNL